MTEKILTQAILKEHLHYDPNVGTKSLLHTFNPVLRES